MRAASTVRLKNLFWPQPHPAVLLGVVALIACFPLWLGRFYAVGDMRDVFIPLEQFFHDEQVAGRLPAWQPDIAWGYPVLASAQIGFFYPPLLALRWLPLTWYLPLAVIGHLLILMLGWYWWLRELARSEQAAIFGSVAFGLSAFVWQHLTHFNIFLSIAWLPWQLLVATRLSRQTRWPLSSLITFTFLLTIPVLAGQLQLPLWMAGFTSLYLLYWSWHYQRRFLKPLIVIAGIAVLVAALAAVQLLPTLELVPLSSRGPEGDFDVVRANQHSFPLYHLPTLLWPRFFGHDYTYWGRRLEIEYGAFIGTLPLLLAGWIAWKARRETHVGFWAVVALVSFSLSLGSLSPWRLIGLEPSLWLFSAPARWLLFTTLAGTVLAAAGWDWLWQAPGKRQVAVRRLAIGTLSLVILANIGLLVANQAIEVVWQTLTRFVPDVVADKPASYYTTKLLNVVASMRTSTVSLASWYAYIPVIMLAAVSIFLRRPRGAHILLGVAIIELLVVAATTNSTLPWSEILSPPPTITALPAAVHAREARIFSTRTGGDTGAYFTDPASRGTPETRAQFKRLLIPLVHSQFGIASVEWPASLDIWAHYKKLERLRGDEGGYVIQDEALAYDLNLGAVLFAAGSVPELNESEVTTVGDVSIQTRQFAPRAEVVDGEDRPVGRASYRAPTPAAVELHVTTPTAGRVVVRDTWYPGWEARVDGQPVAIERYHDTFRAVAVPAGTHDVVMRYVPRRLYHGLIISVSALLILLCLRLTPGWRTVTI